MYKIAYLSHVKSTWARQRPHIIYEGLSRRYDVVWYEFGTILDLFKANNVIVELPFRRFRHYPAYDIFNNCLVKVQLSIRLRKTNLLWVTSPLLVDKYRFPKKKIIYDCMDDFAQFFSREVRDKVASREMDFFHLVDLVFFSSLHLKKKYQHQIPAKSALVRNAINFDRIDQFSQVSYNPKYKVVYWGTISTWFDWRVIDIFIELGFEIELYGPIEGEIDEKYKRFLFGPVDFKLLPSISQSASILIMPFKINELIRGVDPVKLYEYVATKAHVVAPFYPEIERFSEIIFTYRSYDDLKDWANSSFAPLSENIILSRREFLRQNTWEQRIKDICLLISDLI